MKPDYAHLQTEKELAKLEKRIAKLYKEARDELEETVKAYFESFEKRDAEMKKLIGTIQNGKEWTEADYKQWRLNQIGRGKWFEALRDLMAERYTKANEIAIAYVNDETPGIYSLNRNYSAYTIDKATGGALTMPKGKLDASWTLFDESTVRRLISENPNLMPNYPAAKALKRGIDLAYGKKQITSAVTSAILQGKSIKGIADDLQSRIPDMNRASAIRTARTSITGAQSGGRQDTYQSAVKMGIKMKKRWLATLDSRTRHSHARLDGEIIDVDGKYSNGCRYPGDPHGKPHEIYNCRCTEVAVLDDVDTSDAKRRAETKEHMEAVAAENKAKNQLKSVQKQMEIASQDDETGPAKMQRLVKKEKELKKKISELEAETRRTQKAEEVRNMSYQEWAGWKKEEPKKPVFTDSEKTELADLRGKYKSLSGAMLFGDESEINRFAELLQKEKASAGEYDYKVMFNQQSISESKMYSWADIPDKKQLGAISTYTRSGYAEINSYLRHGSHARPETKSEIEELTAFLEKSTVKDTVYLQRGVSSASLDKIFGQAARNGVSGMVGQVVEDKGFVSTTPLTGGGFGGDIHMYIKAPPGTKGAYIRKYAAAENEKEFLLQKGTTFIIRDVKEYTSIYGNVAYDVFLEVIP